MCTNIHVFNTMNNSDKKKLEYLDSILKDNFSKGEYSYNEPKKDAACIEQNSNNTWEIYLCDDNSKADKTTCNDIDEMITSIIIKLSPSYKRAGELIKMYFDKIGCKEALR